MMRNVLGKSTPSVSKVRKRFNPNSAQRCYGLIECGASFLTAQCHETSCVRGRCWETIENTTCLCEAGFQGDRCEKGEDPHVFNHQVCIIVFNCDCELSQMSHCVWCCTIIAADAEVVISDCTFFIQIPDRVFAFPKTISLKPSLKRYAYILCVK